MCDPSPGTDDTRGSQSFQHVVAISCWLMAVLCAVDDETICGNKGGSPIFMPIWYRIAKRYGKIFSERSKIVIQYVGRVGNTNFYDLEFESGMRN